MRAYRLLSFLGFGLVFVTTAASAQVPSVGPTGISTARPTTPADITAACGHMLTTPGNAPASAVAAQFRGQQAFGASNYEMAATEYWRAFALQPVPGRLTEFSTALVGLDGPAQPQLCAVLACLREQSGQAERGAIEARQRSANCAPQPTNVVVPPSNQVAEQRFTLTSVERAAFSNDLALANRARDEHAFQADPSGAWSLPVSYRPVLAAAVRSYQASLTTVTPPNARRSTLAWAGSIGGWTIGAAGLATFLVEGLACNNANNVSAAANSGQTMTGWNRQNYVDGQNACLGANIGLGVGLAGLAGGTLTFLLTMPHGASTPPARRAAIGFAPAVSPGYTGVNLFGSF